jgi:hypothetical protein
MKSENATLKEELEDTKWVIIIHISKNRQHNGKKRTSNDLQNIHVKLMIEYHEPQNCVPF